MNCPNCQAPIEQDFGMVTCHQCQHLFFIDVDGSAQSADSGEQAADDHFSQDLQDHPLSNDPPQSFESEPIGLQVDSAVSGENTEQDLFQESGADEAPGPLASVAQSEEQMKDSVANQVDQISLDVTDFANSNATGLSYHLVIERIDTGEIRNMLSVALSDDRFGWDVRELMGKIKEGNLEIKNIHPAKLIVLMNRLRKVPVSVIWSQSVYEAN